MKQEQKNYRSITEQFLQQRFVKNVHFAYLAIAFLALTLGALLYFTVNVYNSYRSVRVQRMVFENQKTYWEEVTKKYTNYPEGYYQAAVFAAKTGDQEEALELLQKALILNPRYQQALELQKTIQEME